MIRALLARLRTPMALWVLASALSLFIAFRAYVAGQVEKERYEAALEAARMDSVADDVAGQIAASKAATIQQENERARQAALNSDDPLRTGLDRLRTNKGGDGEAAPRPADVR